MANCRFSGRLACGRLRENISADQSFVFVMVADPEPDHFVAVSHAKRAVGKGDSCREDWSGGVDLSEP